MKIARADENIARAKAGMPVTAITRQVEKNFFDLLVAQRERVAAQADSRHARKLDYVPGVAVLGGYLHQGAFGRHHLA